MKFHPTVRLATAVAAVSALAVLAGCSGDSTPTPTGGSDAPGDAVIDIPGATSEAAAYLNDLYQAALASGDTEITLYSPSASTAAPLLKVFEDRFPGIRLELVNKGDAEILTTMQTEAATGQRIGDLWWGGDSIQAARENLCTPVEVVTGPDGWTPFTAFDDQLIYFAHRMFGLVYNTDLVAEADAPTSWNDLLDAEWTGKIAIGNPNAGALRHIFTGMLRTDEEGKGDVFGEDFVKAFAAQDLQYVDPERNVSAEVASGRFPVGAGVFLGYFLEQKELGAPLEFVFPLTDGGNFLTRTALCVAEDGPAPDATALLVNWVFTQEAQEAFATIDISYSAVPGAPGPLGMPSLDDIERLPFSSPDPDFNRPYFEFIEQTFTNPNAQ